MQSGYPKYSDAFLKPRHSVYYIHTSQVNGVVLEVPQFVQSVDKSAKLYYLSLSYDALIGMIVVVMICLMIFALPLLFSPIISEWENLNL